MTNIIIYEGALCNKKHHRSNAAGKLELGFENWLLFIFFFASRITPFDFSRACLIVGLEQALVADLGVAHLLQAIPVGLLLLRHHLSCCGRHCQ
jgi:hypothetical protein